MSGDKRARPAPIYQGANRWFLKSILSNSTSWRWHLWEIDLRFATVIPPGWLLRPAANGRMGRCWATSAHGLPPSIKTVPKTHGPQTHPPPLPRALLPPMHPRGPPLPSRARAGDLIPQSINNEYDFGDLRNDFGES